MRKLTSTAEVDEALGATGIIFKHSTRCPVSYDAHEQVERFAASRPDVTVWLVDVVASRPLAQRIAAATDVVHQSPQVLVLADGRLVWHASHYGISSAALQRHVT